MNILYPTSGLNETSLDNFVHVGIDALISLEKIGDVTCSCAWLVTYIQDSSEALYNGYAVAL